MAAVAARLLERLDRGQPVAWIVVAGVEGSAPREAGASMAVWPLPTDGASDAGRARSTPGGAACAIDFVGTIGGGHLEFEAIDTARRLLADPALPAVVRRRRALGPALGQCCGGAVDLVVRRLDAGDRDWVAALAAAERDGGTVTVDHCVPPERGAGQARADVAGAARRARSQGCPASTQVLRFAPWTVVVFGAGHVAVALARILGTLDARLTVVDPRADWLARVAAAEPGATVLESDSPVGDVAALPAGADVLVMTHSHALDLDLCAALLARDDLGSVGVIGSVTKAARFRNRLAARGPGWPERAARLVTPLGLPITARKDPGAVALSIAAQLIGRRAPTSGLTSLPARATIGAAAPATPGAASLST